jgi:hypothetical protein
MLEISDRKNENFSSVIFQKTAATANFEPFNITFLEELNIMCKPYPFQARLWGGFFLAKENL